MNRSRMRIALGAMVVLTVASLLVGCGFKKRLVGITVSPGTATFLTPDPNAQIVFTAIGSYIHPPVNQDITAQVTWKTDVPQLLTVSGGVVSPTGICGIADISASMQDNGNLIIGYATVTIDDPTIPTCPGGSTAKAVVTVSLAGTGAGTVTSVPSGINCPAQLCGAQFNVGDTIVLDATPNSGHSLTGWANCTTVNGNSCSLDVPKGSTSIVATFN
jgi:Divergent InlB B-repeat domain